MLGVEELDISGFDLDLLTAGEKEVFDNLIENIWEARDSEALQLMDYGLIRAVFERRSSFPESDAVVIKKTSARLEYNNALNANDGFNTVLTPSNSRGLKQEEITQATIDCIPYKLYNRKDDVLLRLPVASVMQRHEKDQPDYYVDENSKNKLGNRIGRALEHLKKYAVDQRLIHIKTGERDDYSFEEFVPTQLTIYNNKIDISDGRHRHRLAALRTLGIDYGWFEVRKSDAEQIKKLFEQNEGKCSVGEIVKGEKVKFIFATIGSRVGTDMKEFAEREINENDSYVVSRVNIDELLNRDVDLKEFINNELYGLAWVAGKYRKKREIATPILLGDADYSSTRNVVKDGYARIAQSIANGDNTICAFVKIEPGSLEKSDKISDGKQFETGGPVKGVLKKFLNSNVAYKIIDSTDAAGTGWTWGACGILAFALKQVYSFPVYVIYNNKKEVVEHFLVKTPDGKFMDGETIDAGRNYTEAEMLEGNPDLVMLEYKPGVNIDDIVLDDLASHKLALLIMAHEAAAKVREDLAKLDPVKSMEFGGDFEKEKAIVKVVRDKPSNRTRLDGFEFKDSGNSDIRMEDGGFFNGNKPYSQLKQQAHEIITGDKHIKRLSQEEERGRIKGGARNVEATLICQRIEGASTEAEQSELQQQELEKYAKADGIWYDYSEKPFEESLAEYYDRGSEAILYCNYDGFLIKAIELYYSASPLDFLDRISLHNHLFPQVFYEVIGFGKNEDGLFVTIVKQQQIIAARKATIEEIKVALAERGYQHFRRNDYYSPNYILDDMSSDNVLIDKFGNYQFVDTRLSLNTKDLKLGGTREIGKEVFEKGGGFEDKGTSGMSFQELTKLSMEQLSKQEPVSLEEARAQVLWVGSGKGKMKKGGELLAPLYAALNQKGIFLRPNAILETDFIDAHGNQVYHPNSNVPRNPTPEQDKEIDKFFAEWQALTRKADPKPTSLDEKLISTPAFKNWFKDSKVVDENGKPLIVYHGTDNDFFKFDESYFGKTDDGFYGRGFYFDVDIMDAKDYGERIIPCFLSIQNPFFLPSEGGSLISDAVIVARERLATLKGIPAEIKPITTLPEGYRVRKEERGRGADARTMYSVVPTEELYGTEKEIYGSEEFNELQAIVSFNDQVNETGYSSTGLLNWLLQEINRNDLHNVIQQNGYDGLIIENLGGGPVEYIVYQPTQTKIADGTNTNFKTDSPDIRYKQGGKMTTNSYDEMINLPSFKKWFGDFETAYKVARLDFAHPVWANVSKIVDKEGKPLVVYHGTPYGKFNKFRKSSGLFFSESKQFALDYAGEKSAAQEMDEQPTVREYFLNLKNPFDGQNINHINAVAALLPDMVSVGLFGKEFSKDVFVNMLRGNYTLQPYWSKEKIDNAKFGRVIGEARDGYNNDIFIGIDKNNNVVYIPNYLQDKIYLLSSEQIQELIDGNPVTVKGYRVNGRDGRVYSAEQLKAAFNKGDIVEHEWLFALHDHVNSKITPYTATQEIEYTTGQDTWQLYELNSVNLFDKIKSLGFDGIKIQERGQSNLVAFEPTQIKVADGSNTTFKKNNADIRLESGGRFKFIKPELPKIEFKKGGKVKDDPNSYLEALRDSLQYLEGKQKRVVEDYIAKLPISKKLIVSLFDYTEKWSGPWIKAGYPILLWDYKIEGDLLNEKHNGGFGGLLSEIRDLIEEEGYELYGILSAQPCTDFAGSGAQYWEKKDKAIIDLTEENPFMGETTTTEISCALASMPLIIAQEFHPVFYACENPVGRMPDLIPEYKPLGPWYFNPYEFAGWLELTEADKKRLDALRIKTTPFTMEDALFVQHTNAYTKKTGLWGVYNQPEKKPIEPVYAWIGGTRTSPLTAITGGKSEKTKALRSITPLGFAKAFYEANKFQSDSEHYQDGGGFNKKNRKFTHEITRDEIFNIIQGNGSKGSRTLIQTAASYLRANVRTSSEGGEKNIHNKEQEKKLIADFVDANQLWFDDDLLIGKYITKGGEQKVYRLDEEYVVKINDCGFYNSWLGYFESLLLHNFFFSPMNYLDLPGKTTHKFLEGNGFENTPKGSYQYYNPTLCVGLMDMHEGNVLTKNDGVRDALCFIDTIAYVSKEPKKFDDGGPIEEFDWVKFLEEEDAKPPLTEEQKAAEKQKYIDEQREANYQKSRYSKKWAPTFADAKAKLINKYLEAKASGLLWASKVYKPNKKLIAVGAEYTEFGEIMSLGHINEGRRRRNIEAAGYLMKEAIEDMERLGLTKEEIGQVVQMEKVLADGGPVDEEFDWVKFFDENADKPGQTEEEKAAENQKFIDEEREAEYQNSKFSKTWAATFAEAKAKLIEQYQQAKAAKELWEGKVYKPNKKVIEVGAKHTEFGESMSVGRINETKRRKQVENAIGDMKAAIADMKLLGLTPEEIGQIEQMEEGGTVSAALRVLRKVELGFPSASSIQLYRDELFIIGDDAPDIYRTDPNYGPPKLIPLFDFKGRIPKPAKVDLESSVIYNHTLIAFGSASAPNRKKIVTMDLRQNPYQPQLVNVAGFMNELEANFGPGGLNIEGATLVNDKLILCSRGNRSEPQNYFIVTRPDFWQRSDTDLYWFSVKLLNGASISDLAYVKHKDMLLFTASTEETSNGYDDGAIGDSYLGNIPNFSKVLARRSAIEIGDNEMLNLSQHRVDFRKQKIEGLCVEQEVDDQYILHLVSDNDDGRSTLFKVVVKVSDY